MGWPVGPVKRAESALLIDRREARIDPAAVESDAGSRRNRGDILRMEERIVQEEHALFELTLEGTQDRVLEPVRTARVVRIIAREIILAAGLDRVVRIPADL